MQEKISIVVPVYGVEKYLCKCLDSIAAQSYRNLEIILVDDGSPDGCGEICDRYASKDERFIVVHQKNMGLSGARNSGAARATGRYIGFVDSDDFIDRDMYECLYRAITEQRADIAVCGYRTVGSRSEEHPGKTQCLTMDQALRKLIGNKEMPSYAWNKLYKRECLEGIPFETGKEYEDVRIMHQVFLRARKVCTIDRCLYNYTIREDSITGKTRNLHSAAFMESLEKRCGDLKDTQYYEPARIAEFVCMRRIGYEILAAGEKKDPFFGKLMEKERRLYAEVGHAMGRPQRFGARLFLISPELYAFLRKTAQKMGI